MQRITTTPDLGQAVRAARRRAALTQPDLALAANVGIRFIVDLEKGKPSCEIGKTLAVLHALNLDPLLPGAGS